MATTTSDFSSGGVIVMDKSKINKPKHTLEERFPEMFAKNRHIDRRQCERTVPMKVLVLGMCRTGTASMWEALKLLGYVDCYHMFNLMIDPDDNDMWIDAINGKYFSHLGHKPFEKKDWDQLLGHCQAVCDLPSCAFGPELIAAYPDAKVVLTNRDIDGWYTSCVGTIRNSMTDPWLHFLGRFDVDVMGKWTKMSRLLFKGLFNDDFEKNGKQVYEDHYRAVRTLVPRENLYEFQIGEGWEGLCEFLGVEVPDFPYPRVNEATSFKDRNRLRYTQAISRGMPRILTALVSVSGFVGVAAYAYQRFWRRR